MKPLFYVVLINDQHGESRAMRVRAWDVIEATDRVLARVATGYFHGCTITEHEFYADEVDPWANSIPTPEEQEEYYRDMQARLHTNAQLVEEEEFHW